MAYWKEKTKPPKTSSVNAAGRHSGGGVGHEAAQKEAFGPIGWGVGWGGVGWGGQMVAIGLAGCPFTAPLCRFHRPCR